MYILNTISVCICQNFYKRYFYCNVHIKRLHTATHRAIHNLVTYEIQHTRNNLARVHTVTHQPTLWTLEKLSSVPCRRVGLCCYFVSLVACGCVCPSRALSLSANNIRVSLRCRSHIIF